MVGKFVQEFLGAFDDSCFPDDFLRDYEIIECFSRLEYSETLLVKRVTTGDYCVAKCYTDKLLTQSRESDLLKKIDHEGLPVYAGEYRNDEMLCVVRSYAPGRTLIELAEKKPLSNKRAVSVAVQLCEILIYLHNQNPPIIHRDIKPHNVVIDEQGRISLIDFGISRRYDKSAQKDTAFLGTENFAAPEQYGFSQTDGRSDIFSLGVLLCWLLTGKVDVREALPLIQDARLARVIAKCTAFDPRYRFSNAVQVRDALTGRGFRRKLALGVVCELVVLVIVLIAVKTGGITRALSGGVSFREPLIEEAVRLAAGKGEAEAITEEDLLSITELYIFGDHAAANGEDFTALSGSFAANEGIILRGSITTLEDIEKLKNLREAALVFQNITDITPLSKLIELQYIDLRHNPLEDVSSLSQVSSLTALVLFDTNVSDLTALRSCTRLSGLDVGYTKIESIAALDGLDSLRSLAIRNAPLQSLEHIDAHPMLEEIYLSGTRITDLSPLFALPRLKSVEVDEELRIAIQSLPEEPGFIITYE